LGNGIEYSFGKFKMHEEILNKNTKCLLDVLGQSQIIKNFILLVELHYLYIMGIVYL